MTPSTAVKKFQVASGTLRETVRATNPDEAALAALAADDRRPGRVVLADFFEVRQRGSEPLFKATKIILSDAGRLAEQHQEARGDA
jgi:hypothetical protein